ncbi:hypothetical protein QA633_39840 [Bradyrhizobium barranii]|uniref:hypothetical protein n=1 Tax=Bradyrhizobium barranii TaxID=2992140 RepID=UPI0024AFD4A5|nr:hypothetical protein [Bradyrhizobium barranii]WFT94353.1 hypothetical protein QA633_39840 [Bradyrhizobium barranii]
MFNTKRKVRSSEQVLPGQPPGLALSMRDLTSSFKAIETGRRCATMCLRRGTAVYFGKSLEYHAEVVEDLYDSGTSTG